jgi:hypothetical protein
MAANIPFEYDRLGKFRMLNVNRFARAVDELADEMTGISRAPRDSGVAVRMKWFAFPVAIEASLHLFDLGRIAGHHPVVAGGLEVLFYQVERRQESALAVHDDGLLVRDQEVGVAPLDLDAGRFHRLEERIVQPFARHLRAVQHDAHPDALLMKGYDRIQEERMRESVLLQRNRFSGGLKKMHDRFLAVIRLDDQLRAAHAQSSSP